MHARITAHVVAMLAMGAAAFSLLGLLVDWRHGQPVQPPATVVAELADGRPAAALAHGLAAAAATGSLELADGDRGQAAHAMDASLRLAMVGRHATTPPLSWAFERAARLVERARVDVQNGAPGDARDHLNEVVATMGEAAPLAEGTEPPGRDELDDYEGASVLDVLGSRLGEIQSFDRTRAGIVARLRVGGSRDVLGFIDLGGRTIDVPADLLLYGDPDLVGTLHVVLPSTDFLDDDKRGD